MSVRHMRQQDPSIHLAALPPVVVHGANPDTDIIKKHSDGGISPTNAAPAYVESTSEPPNDQRHAHQNLKLFSAGFSFFVAGTNDGSMGALIPYIIQDYNINTSLIAVLYITTFAGWLLAALTNSHAPKFFQTGTLLAFGAALQLLSNALRAWKPPFGLLAVAFFLTGLGMAYQDSHANTFVSSVKGAHRWLGFIHAMYAFGCLVSPFVATAVAAANTPSKWYLFYLFPLGLSIVNLSMVIVAFRDSLHRIRRHVGSQDASEGNLEQLEHGRNKSAMKEWGEMLRMRELWLISLFFFFYLGAGTTSGGWVVEYLVDVRDGNLATMGYVPAGSYGGMCLGRLLLAEPTHRFGEKRMLLLYATICLAMQLIFWLVPNIISSAISFSIMGFFFGPFFAAGISVASRLFPKKVQPAALGMVFVVAQAGGAIFPSLTGLVATHAGVKVLQPIVVGLIIATAAAWALVPKVESHRD